MRSQHYIHLESNSKVAPSTCLGYHQLKSGKDKEKLTLRKPSKSTSSLISECDSPNRCLISSSLNTSFELFSFMIKEGISPTVTLPFSFFTASNCPKQKHNHTTPYIIDQLKHKCPLTGFLQCCKSECRRQCPKITKSNKIQVRKRIA